MSPSYRRLHIPSFCLDARAQHGGVKRSHQLSTLALAEGADILTVPANRSEAIRYLSRAPWSSCVALLHAIRLFGRKLSLKGLFAAVLYGGWLHSELKKTDQVEVDIEISPNLHVVLGNMLVSFGVTFRAIPHNIEFMVPDQSQSYFRGSISAFAAETRIYRNARAVATISQFDTAVLRSLGIRHAQTLAYTPVGMDKDLLDEVRTLRETSVKQGILILGSASNPPTRQGILHLFDIMRAEQPVQRFVLAGFGTEELAHLAPHGVEVKGGVSTEVLRALLVECQAMLVYQVQTSGMLTRLVEASISGIPAYVLGGYHQALELRNNGVHAIDKLDELPLPYAKPASLA